MDYTHFEFIHTIDVIYFQAAAERGEKAEILEERSTKLAEGARSFSENARRLREQAAAGH